MFIKPFRTWNLQYEPLSRLSRLLLPFTLIIILSFTTVALAEDINFEAISFIESSNNPLAYNQSSGARGLFQITKICLQDYNKWHSRGHYTLADLFDPAINKHIAVWYLTERIPQMLRYYKLEVNIRNILFSYNWGIGNVVNWYKNGADIKNVPEETKNYLDRYNWRANR